MRSLKVLVADDHWVARASIISLLPQLAEAVTTAEAVSAETIIEKIETEGPFDLVILDLNMPQTDPWETIFQIRSRMDSVPIMIMSVSERREDVLGCLEHGAVGYVPKTAEPEAIVRSMKRVLAGEVTLPLRILQTESGEPHASVISDDRSFALACAAYEKLTPRQKEIFIQLGEEASNQEIADNLGLSINTVRVHIQSIATKLNERNRTKIAALALRIGRRVAQAA
ncbi:Two Component Transcriptional Regulator, LuxR family protein [Parvularcula bermudensis HTCC2503]|uniref:Two Component Transcriptional Regulator, LuxR family protein n=1 Tax=Parvularcula bermudensis (strain ATCC BAA-594 / HTCC2503 / KCTC 12087) TaxID=314260 RepID=E0TFW8_PARBH|nr:response regulator transcription factor [Parvularcula bermudensis]ADM09567.1 Two Component Transcriptional Regulator, LuxR family protein [Parvularcula bermudensis HTCC2503]